MTSLATLVILAGILSSNGHTGHHTILTDASFEHVTQASTGQTTGTWAIRFCGYGDGLTAALCEGPSNEVWESMRDDMLEENIFLATVDVGKNEGLARRFQRYIAEAEGPLVVLLRRGGMYIRRLDAPDLALWMVSGWEKEESLEVPGEIGWLDQRKNGMVVVGGCLVMLCILVVWILRPSGNGAARTKDQ